MIDPAPVSDERRYSPRLIAWELTRACPLRCKHCRAAAQPAPYGGELSTDECFRLLDNIASFARPIIILTGGEPMLRPDVCDIAGHAHDLDLPVVMATCGTLIDEESAPPIARSGIRRISISLDGASAASHDEFRGVRGAFEGSLRGIEAAKRAGVDFQINTTVSRYNLAELPAIFDLAVKLGASAFNPFLLVPTGRGRQLADQELSAEQYEETLRWLAGQQDRRAIELRVTCAPHYQRLLRQQGRGRSPERHPVKGCMGGQSFAFISHRGKVQICGFLEVECGDVRREGLDFRNIWETSEVFKRVRDLDSYRGRCGYCEFRKVCGGCRARAYALTGDYLAEEPFCVHRPRRVPTGRKRECPGELDELDRKLLTIIQADLPVAERPFDVLAGRLGTTPEEVMARTGRLHAEGIIRRVGAVFDSRRLGYASTLVAARVPPERVAEVAGRVNRLPGVTHNYRREHVYNLWFTLIAPSEEEIECVLDDLRRTSGIAEFYNLPALTVYKIRVNFRLGDEAPEPDAVPPGPPGAGIPLDGDQENLVRFLQDDLPLVPEPFAAVAGKLGWRPRRILEQVSDWLASGVIRRFGAVVAHRRLGFTANGMAVFRVGPDRVDGVGRRLARYPDISHCYRRPPLPAWNYNLFAMFHGRSADQVRRLVARIADDLDLTDWDVLFSTVEYKKTSMKYFVPVTGGERPPVLPLPERPK